MNLFIDCLKNQKRLIIFELIIFFIFSTFPSQTFSFEKKNIKLHISANNIEKDINNEIKPYYLLGPSDLLSIEFKGLDIFSGKYLINPEGEVYMPEIGVVKAQGLTLNELKDKLIEKYQNTIINPDFIINIIDYRPVTIYITGEVKSPGLYNLDNHDKTTPQGREITRSITYPKLFNALQVSEGVTNYADLSKIIVTRKNSKSQGGGKIRANVDLLSLIKNGDQSQNIRLYDGDSIEVLKTDKILKDQVLAINRTNINPNQINVFITGNVMSGGSVFLKKGSSLIQAIATTGGKKILTGNIEFIRFNDDGKTTSYSFRYDKNAPVNTIKNPILMDGDVIKVNKTILGKTTTVLNEFSRPIFSGALLYNIFN